MIYINNFSELKINFLMNNGDPGFHGDIRMIETMDDIIKKCDHFIETGTRYGNTLFFVSRNYNIKCWSCEIGDMTPQSVYNHDNVYFQQIKSPDFLYFLEKKHSHICEQTCVFYLDAHSDTESVWEEELAFILKNFSKFYIVIDDFNIMNDSFSHNGYSLSVAKSIIKNRAKIYVPDYREQTSEFHSLTGWILITNIDESFRNVKELYE